jgi:hypothetical protein
MRTIDLLLLLFEAAAVGVTVYLGLHGVWYVVDLVERRLRDARKSRAGRWRGGGDKASSS